MALEFLAVLSSITETLLELIETWQEPARTYTETESAAGNQHRNLTNLSKEVDTNVYGNQTKLCKNSLPTPVFFVGQT